MKRKYNWTSAALLAALFSALSFQAAMAQGSGAHSEGWSELFDDLNSVIFDSSTQSVTSEPAFITTQEAGLDAVFSQASFGANPIDIIVEATLELVNANFLNLETPAETNSLLGIDLAPSPTINIYYVDTVTGCGSQTNVNIVGCGQINGNNQVIESSFLAGGFGAELLAHELGHNLGLPHLAGANLMDPTLNNNTTLTAAQVTTIRNSFLSQGTLGDEFIRIQPILVVATATIPEPTSLLLLLLGTIASVSARGRRKR
jgi:hypothetical protein